MNERISQKLPLSRITILTLICISMSLVSCGPQLRSIRILPAKPVEYTSPSCYPAIEEIYQSDDQIFLVSTWGRAPSSNKKHLLQWKLYNPKGESMYLTTDRYVVIKPNTFYTDRISLSQKTKDEFKSGMYTIELYLDDKLFGSQKVDYINKSIINVNIDGAVVLPFSFDGESYVRHKGILNTTANAIYGEVKRIVKETVPPTVAEQRIGGSFSPKYFDDPDRMSKIKELFSEDILVAGSVKLAEYTEQEHRLTVYIYHSKKGYYKKFTYLTHTMVQKYTLILSELIKGVLHNQHLTEYLRYF